MKISHWRIRLTRGYSRIYCSIVLLILSGCYACYPKRKDDSPAIQEQSTVTGSSTSVSNSNFQDLKRSKFCSDAAQSFWSRHNWKDNTDLNQIVSYTSHYNTRLNKCLVDVHGVSTLNKGRILEADHIYDALEDKVLGGQLLTKKSADPDADIEGATLIRDGHPVKDKEAVNSFIPWFRDLMIE